MTVSSGLKKSYSGFENAVTAPSREPNTMPEKQPSEILPSEPRQSSANSLVTQSSPRRRSTVSGDGKRKLLPTASAASCQSRSHAAMTPLF